MLQSLSIRDVVLIDRLELGFHPGLGVLTGETGAGKSILLDALGLALGVRAESGLVRTGAEQAVVSAEFSLPAGHPARLVLSEHGFIGAGEEQAVLRRVLAADGRSRAFINDQPASIGLLREVGELLVEIEGQFAQRGLLDAGTHREALDAFGGHGAEVETLRAAFRTWRDARAARAAAEEQLAKARAEEDYLRHALGELETLKPEQGEEQRLAESRGFLQQREKLGEALEGALAELAGDRGAERAVNAALRPLERLRDRLGERLDPAVAALDRVAGELREAVAQIEAALHSLGPAGLSLEQIEERLFALRALARKHGASVDGLVALRTEIAAKVAALEDGGGEVKRLQRREAELRNDYVAAASRLGERRRAAAKSLDAAVAKELKPLKLERARFQTVLAPLPEPEWGEGGAERVHFEVQTNPGAPPGPIGKIASGGELARFLLALKVVLARTLPATTLVFDEVDSGIGGAVAAAVGERLHRLGESLQVLVVTHSPQVAAKGTHHWRVAKRQAASKTLTTVDELTAAERREEIARMLSGSTVTAEARAAAASLMGAGPS
ncbi:MAG TPA: DNA repair protein RecN [Stellaceae bacterium]|nr:DNA repair protein RecN [Stellaceae bacterium]